MKPHFLLIGLLLAAGLGPVSEAADKTAGRSAKRVEFSGWSDAIALASRESVPSATVVPSVGGRVMFYGRRGENILWVNPETVGRTLASAGGIFQPGGFQCDLGPEVAGLPVHPELWVGAYEATRRKDDLYILRAPTDRALPVEMEKGIRFDPSTGDVGFLHRIKNNVERDAAYSLWHRIACQPGGFVVLPLNRKSRFPAGWSMQRQKDGKLSYDGASPESPAVRILDGILVAKTGGPATKIGADSDAQWVAYARGRTFFIIHFPMYSSATYSEGGNSVTVSWDERMTELQPHSPEARLRSRRTYEFPSKWSLVELPAEVTTPEDARALASTVPGSPFQ